MGDVDAEGRKWLLREYILPHVDILKVGHHGSMTSSASEFVRHVRPKYALVSVGRNNHYDYPVTTVIERYRYCGSKVIRIDEDENFSIAF